MSVPRSSFAYFYNYPSKFAFIVGGRSETNDMTTKAEMLDVYGKEWTQLPGVTLKRANPALTCIKDEFLFAIGGFSGNDS